LTEAYLKAQLVLSCRKMMPGCVVFRHEDKFRSGVPDLSVTWWCRTAWAEVKLNRLPRRSVVTPLQSLYLRLLGGLLVTYSTAPLTPKLKLEGVQVVDCGKDRMEMALRGDRFSSYHVEVAKLLRGKILAQLPEDSQAHHQARVVVY
jgi:hypothetical protein